MRSASSITTYVTLRRLVTRPARPNINTFHQKKVMDTSSVYKQLKTKQLAKTCKVLPPVNTQQQWLKWNDIPARFFLTCVPSQGHEEPVKFIRATSYIKRDGAASSIIWWDFHLRKKHIRDYLACVETKPALSYCGWTPRIPLMQTTKRLFSRHAITPHQDPTEPLL